MTITKLEQISIAKEKLGPVFSSYQQQYDETHTDIVQRGTDAELERFESTPTITQDDVDACANINDVLLLSKRLKTQIAQMRRTSLDLADRPLDRLPSIVQLDDIDEHQKHCEFLTTTLRQQMKEIETLVQSSSVLISSMKAIVDSGELDTKTINSLARSVQSVCDIQVSRDRTLKQFLSTKKTWDDAKNLSSQREILTAYSKKVALAVADREIDQSVKPRNITPTNDDDSNDELTVF